jgi:hypothetical protein
MFVWNPECEKVLRQTQASLHAMKLHIVDYRLKILLLSLRNPVESSDSPHANGKEMISQNISAPRNRTNGTAI